MTKQRHTNDALQNISRIVETKGVLKLDYEDGAAIAYETGYIFGRLLRKFGIRAGAAPAKKPATTGTPAPHNKPATESPQKQDQAKEEVQS